MTQGSVDCLALHKQGLYAAGMDGVLRKLEIRQERIKVSASHNLGLPVTSLDFNGMHNKLALGSSRVSCCYI